MHLKKKLTEKSNDDTMLIELSSISNTSKVTSEQVLARKVEAQRA